MNDETKFTLAAGNRANIETFPNVRITLITPQLIRFEYSPDNVFEDRQTLAVVNRDLGKVKYKVRNDGKKILIDTGMVNLAYLADGKPLSRENLQISFSLSGKKKQWAPGDSDSGNLRGSCRTLDCCNGSRKVDHRNTPEQTETELELCNGLISREGWSLIDDSTNVVIDRKKGQKWVAPRTDAPGRQDWYLFAYGHCYADAIRDGARVFGSQPLAPRYVLGYWFSRYWAYSDLEIETLLDGFDRADIPIDVMVIDMDWHLEGWTGYTWDKRYFPNPDEFLKHLHDRGVKVTLNLHPADGVGRQEEQFEEMARAMDLDPAKTERVPFDITDPKYMKNYFKILHHPNEKRGVDFWWMDWQQGESTAMKGLDTLPWINQLHWEDMLNRKNRKRPLIFSRFGGIGAGRYAVGFSGDTISTWESLAYQPYFTATAANVLYGYWSHDIGGHMPGVIEPELYTRWMQFGLYSPVLRTHTTKNVDAERRFQAYPEPYGELMGDIVRRRYELVPYIYSELHEAAQTGLSLIRGIYFLDPEDENCYHAPQEYMFGRSMLLSPISRKMDEATEQLSWSTYLPAGDWYDTVWNCFEEGKRTVNRKYRLEEIPCFVRPGTIIPEQFGCHRLNDKCYKNLSVNVYPGNSGSYDLYEDDGISTDYRKNKYAIISMSHHTSGKNRIVNLFHRDGDFKGYEKKRNCEIKLTGCVPPEKVTMDGMTLPFVYRFDSGATATPAWRYDGESATIVIRLGKVDLECGVEVKIHFRYAEMYRGVEGLPAAFRRLRRIGTLHNSVGGARVTESNERLGQELAHTAVRISLNPETFESEMANLKEKLPQLAPEMEKLAALVEKPEAPGFRTAFAAKARRILEDSGLITSLPLEEE